MVGNCPGGKLSGYGRACVPLCVNDLMVFQREFKNQSQVVKVSHRWPTYERLPLEA